MFVAVAISCISILATAVLLFPLLLSLVSPSSLSDSDPGLGIHSVVVVDDDDVDDPILPTVLLL